MLIMIYCMITQKRLFDKYLEIALIASLGFMATTVVAFALFDSSNSAVSPLMQYGHSKQSYLIGPL